MSSSRFPGKPMTKILGKPMIQHVYERVSSCDSLDDTYVATCDLEIYNFIISIGGKAVMTANTHDRASDRCAEALLKIEKEKKIIYDIVVMVQGDEPMTNSEMVQESLNPIIYDNEVNVTNLKGKIDSIKEFEDRNCIKVICDLNDNALAFSREPIPTRANTNNIEMFKQVCVISFRRNFLLDYCEMPPTNLEIIESIDMMRVIENGFNVKMVTTNHKSYSIDVLEDKDRVERFMKNNL